jgi:translation initiation factor IF-2
MRPHSAILARETCCFYSLVYFQTVCWCTCRLRLIHHARIPLVVAVNKCDMFMHNFNKVKADLLKEGITDEKDGGDTFIVPISAKTGLHVAELLEAIQFTAELIDLRADYTGLGEAMVVESKVDRGLGPQANIIVDRGVLRVGDVVVSGVHHGRVRKLLDHMDKELQQATPSTPVSLIGLNGAPDAGADLLVVPDMATAEQVVAHRKEKLKRLAATQLALSTQAQVSAAKAASSAVASTDTPAALTGKTDGGTTRKQSKTGRTDSPAEEAEDPHDAFVEAKVEELRLADQLELKKKADQARMAEQEVYSKLSADERRTARRERKRANKLAMHEERKLEATTKQKPCAVLVVKADNHGSLKTILDFIAMIPRDEVDIKVCDTGIGEITASDVQHAHSFQAKIFGFNVRASANVLAIAKHDGVGVHTQELIYSIFDDLRVRVRAPVRTSVKVCLCGSW